MVIPVSRISPLASALPLGHARSERSGEEDDNRWVALVAELGLLCAPFIVAGIWRRIWSGGGGSDSGGTGDEGGNGTGGRTEQSGSIETRAQEVEALPRTERTTVPIRVKPLPDATPEFDAELEGEAWRRWRSLISWAKSDEGLSPQFQADVGAIVGRLTCTKNVFDAPQEGEVAGEATANLFRDIVSRYLSTVNFSDHPRRTAMHLMVLLAAFRKMSIEHYERQARQCMIDARESRMSRVADKLRAAAEARREQARLSRVAWQSAANAAHALGEGSYGWAAMYAREAVQRGRSTMSWNSDMCDYVAGIVGAYANLCESRQCDRGLWNTTLLKGGIKIIEGLRRVYGDVPENLGMIGIRILTGIDAEMIKQRFFDPLWPMERVHEARDVALEAYIRRGEHPSRDKADPSFTKIVGNAVKINESRNFRLSDPKKKRWYPVAWEDYPAMETFERMVLVASTILSSGETLPQLMGYDEVIFLEEIPLDTIAQGEVMEGMGEDNLVKAIDLGLDAGIPLSLVLESTLPAFWIGKEVSGCAVKGVPDTATLHEVSSIMRDIAARSTVREGRFASAVGALQNPANGMYGPTFGRIKPLLTRAYTLFVK